MAESSPQITPDFVMVRTLEGIQDLRDQIWPGQPRKNAKPPFIFYLQTDDSEDEALDKLTGLRHTGYQLHVVAADYRKLPILGGKIKAAVNSLEGRAWPRADSAVCDLAIADNAVADTDVSSLVGRAWPRADSAVCDLAIVDNAVADTDSDGIFFEDVIIQQVSPDLFDNDVCLFRRVYQLDIDYQTERSNNS